MTTNTKTQRISSDEPKAVEQASAALDTLTPTTARDDAIAFDLRYASRLMTEAIAKGSSSGEALRFLRANASNALSAVAVSLDRRTLTQEMIATARQAVELLLAQTSA